MLAIATYVYEGDKRIINQIFVNPLTLIIHLDHQNGLFFFNRVYFGSEFLDWFISA